MLVPRTLQPNHTPWDDLDRDALLMEVRRMYAALNAAHCTLTLCASGDPSRFWGREGSGGCALEMARQVIEPLSNEFGEEAIYRAYFRYANDLLFDCSRFDIGFGWMICPECKRTYGDRGQRATAGKRCNDMLETGCEGVLRELRWEDLGVTLKPAP